MSFYFHKLEPKWALRYKLGVKKFRLIILSCQVKKAGLTKKEDKKEDLIFVLSVLIKMFLTYLNHDYKIERVKFLAIFHHDKKPTF